MNFLLQSPLRLHSYVNEQLWSSTEAEGYQALITDFLLFGVVCLVALILYFICNWVVLGLVRKALKKTKNDWDDELLKSRLFTWISLVIPLVVIWKGGERAFLDDRYSSAIQTFGEVGIIVLAFFALHSILNVGERIYRRYEISKKFPIKGFIQVVKIILTICCTIFIISAVIGKSPLSLFAGLGAMSAVLMFIFKDSILGLVAGIQLSANQMVARGDWIEVPKFGADGEVLEVALTTVKVRNWDKTITTLPTYALISDSFKNWRGMSSSKVRRIKRALHIDLQTVKFVDDVMLEKLRKIHLLKEYLEEKEQEIKTWNSERDFCDTDIVNARVITNVGTFRAYVVAYLRNHQKIAQGETLLVRQLQASEYGLPIEIYVFSKDNRWVEFEGIQSDIFDHFFSILQEFDLQLFQRPSGSNFDTLE